MAVLLHLAQGDPQGGGGSPWSFPILMVLIFVVIYFMMIRPQRKQAKERDSMIGALKKNDHVLTTGGIFGIVDKVKDKEVVLKVDEKSDVRLRVAKTAIVGVIKDSGAEEKKAEPEQSKK
jgi:preprotein translocase subunit YajC